MKNFKKYVAIGLLITTTLFTACGKGKNSTNTDSVSLTVSAAASLRDALEEIKGIYEKENSSVIINYNFGSSGGLQKQIEQGAPVDIFLSAGEKQMKALRTENLIMEDTYRELLKNQVVLVVPKDSKISLDFKALTEDKVKKIGIGDIGSVPAGQYGKEVLDSLNIFDEISSKIVYGKDVREVLAWVETGNVEAGIVYKTDAKVTDKVKIVAESPVGSHEDIIYPGAIIKDSKNVAAAKGFLDFLSKEKSIEIFKKYGFEVVE